MELIGLWGDQRKVIRFAAIAFWMTFMIIIPKSCLEYDGEGFDSFARGTAELIYFTDFVLSMVFFAFRRKSYVRMITILQDSFQQCANANQPASCRAAITNFNRRIFRFSRVYACFIGSCLIFYVPLPMTATFVNYFSAGNGTELVEFVLPLENKFYGLDIRRNLAHYLIYMILLVPAVCGSACLSTVKGTILFTIIRYGATLFELVSLKIDALGRSLKEIVELHKTALEFANLLESTMQHILLSQFVNCMLISCLMMFYISSTYGPNVVNMIILFAVLLVEVFAYCYNGNELSEKAANVAGSIYNYPWYLEPASMQKQIQLMIARSQKKTGITAAKYYFVDIERFGLVMQASYSYYLILKERFNV
ncbi:odorant receptor Or2-like [Toxorhynchites rutilus septentrionalis]|uniref:odorant receptor Or2-like n=1 Tax=Toxorhynchites rutilus septentrionalis TaxID=329112 RepID=UPI0024794199|nr:odorant receptor Or2-like [Toxorhynchites rutilus septentrionalis]